MPKLGRLVAGWDTCDIINGQVAFLKESGDYEGKTDDELFQIAADDPDLFDWNWSDLCDYLTELMGKNRHGGWKAVVHDFGWRSLDGCKLLHATTGKALLQAVLPRTDCTFKVYRYGRGLAINNAHHDSPTWAEWYYITPCKQALAA